MEHTTAVHSEHHHESPKGEVKRVTIILSVLTMVELGFGYWMISIPDGTFLKHFIKGVICILMLAKAFYIVGYFMHLKHELKNMVMTIVVPLLLFVWFILAFLSDGNSYLNLRMKLDPYKKEQTTKKVEKQTDETEKTHKLD